MEQWYIVNADGFMIDVVLPDNVPSLEQGQQIVKYPWTVGMYKPKWTGNTWVEGLTQQEIDEINSRPPIKTPEQKEMDKLKTDNTGLNDQIIGLWETLLNAGVL